MFFKCFGRLCERRHVVRSLPTMNGWVYGLIGALGMLVFYTAPARRRWRAERHERKREHDRLERRAEKKHRPR